MNSKMSDIVIFSESRVDMNGLGSRSWGSYSIASHFRSIGFSTQVIDYIYNMSHEELERAIKKYVSSDTKVVGIGAAYWEFYPNHILQQLSKISKLIIEFSKNINPNIKIIAGGPSVRIFLRENFPKVDAIFEGFSESDSKKYLEHVFNNTPKPLENSIVRNTSIYNNVVGEQIFFSKSKTSYVEHDYILKNEVPILEIGRGCIFNCKFCSFALKGKKKLDYIKDQSLLRDELIENYEKYGMDKYIFVDDTFNDSQYKLDELYKTFSSLPFKMNFSAFLRLDLLNAHQDQIQQLQEMGLTSTFFGVETFHYQAAKEIGKGIHPDKVKELLHRLTSVDWKDKVKVAITLLIGLPHETYESHEETLKWILDENNLVDQVVPHPLIIQDPKTLIIPEQYPNVSKYQLESEKYGFYWKDDPLEWHNHIGPVKSRQETLQLYARYIEAVKRSNRVIQGGFNLHRLWPLVKVYKPNLEYDDLLKMSRKEFDDLSTYILEKDMVESTLVNTYKRKLLEDDQTL